MKARFYETDERGSVSCHLCEHRWKIAKGKRGICGVRENREGVLESLVYGMLVACHIDPIEKKPLYHFLPASTALSIATAGCNFSCLHCQNSEISQAPAETGMIEGRFTKPQDVIETALDAGSRSIAYTYTEPTIFLEYALDVASEARDFGLKNVFVSNGYMTNESLEEAAPLLDAINVDLKGDAQFYRKVCGARVEPVLRNIENLHRLGVWVEVTTLVIPGFNDSDRQLDDIARFLSNLSPDIPWHVSAFHPDYRLTNTGPTDSATIRHAVMIGRKAGLSYVYAGNIAGESDHTVCPNCKSTLVSRLMFKIVRNAISDGKCPNCKEKIAGIWE